MKKQIQRLAATAALAFAGFAAQATPVVVDVTGAQSINLLGETGNTVWLIDIGANTMLNSVSWAVTLEALSPSWLADMQVSFGDSSARNLVSFAPGSADAVSGTGSYSGLLDLSGLDLAAGADGKLRLEFHEGFKDFNIGITEGNWISGQLSFDVSNAAAVPEPASAALALLGLGLVAGASRRRRH
jgi:hypothetical protein